jgi:hypothetical protein
LDLHAVVVEPGPGPQRDPTSVRHGVACVRDEVREELLDLGRLGEDLGVRGGEHGRPRVAFAGEPREQRVEVAHLEIDRHGHPCGRAPPREQQELRGQGGRAAGGGQELIDVLDRGRVLVEDLAGEGSFDLDDREHVVEVVGDAAGHLPDDLHLLREHQPIFERGADLGGLLHPGHELLELELRLAQGRALLGEPVVGRDEAVDERQHREPDAECEREQARERHGPPRARQRPRRGCLPRKPAEVGHRHDRTHADGGEQERHPVSTFVVQDGGEDGYGEQPQQADTERARGSEPRRDR